jgi:hypothetical protein
VKFIVMQFSPWSSFLPFRSKYSPQQTVLKHTQSVFLPQSEDQVLHLNSSTGEITALCILIFIIFIWDRETKYFGLNDRKYSLNLIYFWFHRKLHSDLFVLSQTIWSLPRFQTVH